MNGILVGADILLLFGVVPNTNSDGAKRRKHFIDDAIEAELLRLWEKRNDYHHLNASVARDQKPLEYLARVFLRNPSV